jgi:hypothetical protein
VSEAVTHITRALADADEGELTAILSSLGAGGVGGARCRGAGGAEGPQMDTHIQIGPTGRKLLPLTVKTPAGASASGTGGRSGG